MTIGILQCGTVPAGLDRTHGTYGAMIQRLLGPGRRVETFDVQQGVLPDRVAGYDAFVLTGSAAGVYDDLPWIPPLFQFLRQARGQAKLVGICFGHQAMAQAFGGAAIKSPKGWGVGLHRYDVATPAPWMDAVPHIDAPASHQDQVVAPPPDARVTLRSGFTPYAGLDYGDAISFQFHPEFTPAFSAALIGALRNRYEPRQAETAIASHQQPSDAPRVGRWISRFLDRPTPI